MKDWWIKTCCFLIGYNYQLVRSSSEHSAKIVRKYGSALLLILVVWFVIGYSFSDRYLGFGTLGSLAAACGFSFVILQIERIIILSSKNNRGAAVFRILLALIMALIGATIVDQILFKKDIEMHKEMTMSDRVQEAIRTDRAQIGQELARIDSQLSVANLKFAELSEEISRNPVIVTRISSRSVTTDSIGNTVQAQVSTTNNVSENPKKNEMDHWRTQIEKLHDGRNQLHERERNLADEKKAALSGQSGFLDELNTLKEVAFSSTLGIAVYLLFLLFFLAIELFVVFIKLFDEESDYEKLIQHQTNIRSKMIGGLRHEPKAVPSSPQNHPEAL